MCNCKINFVVISIGILLLSQILNQSKFATGVGDIEISYIIAVFFVLLQIFKKRNLNINFIDIMLVGLLSVISIISTIASDVVSWTSEGSSLLACILLYLLVTSIPLNRNCIKIILVFYTTIVFAVSLGILYESSNNMFSIYGTRYTVTILGTHKDPNYLSSFMVPCLVYLSHSCFFNTHTKIFYRFCLLLMILIMFISIFYTGSRAAMLSIVMSLFILAPRILSHKNAKCFTKVAIFLLVPLLVLMVNMLLMDTPLYERMFSLSSYTHNIRLLLWHYALEAFFLNPVLGTGIQSGSYFVDLYTERWNASHNCFIDIVTSSGCIGVILLICIYGTMLRIKNENKVFMLSIMFAFFIPLFFINGYESLTFWMPMILCKIISNYCKKENYYNLL